MKKILLIIGWLLGLVLIGQPNRASAFEPIELMIVIDSCTTVRSHLNSRSECSGEDCIDVSARLVLIQEEDEQHCRLFVDGSSPRFSTPRSAHFKGVRVGATENILDFEIDYSGVNFVYDIPVSSEFTQFGDYEITYSCGFLCSETKRVNFTNVDYTPPPRSGSGEVEEEPVVAAEEEGCGWAGCTGVGIVPDEDEPPLVDPALTPPEEDVRGPVPPGTVARGNNDPLDEIRFPDQGNLQGGGCSFNPRAILEHGWLNFGWLALIGLLLTGLRKKI